MPLQQKKSSRSFTMVEILIVIAIFSMMALVLYQSLSNGLAVWQRANQNAAEEDVLLFFDQLSQDFRNTLVFRDIPFLGSAINVIFPTQVSFLDDETTGGDGNYHKKMGVVNYYYDKNQKAICRKTATFGQAMNHEFSLERVLVKGVDSVDFSYYFPGNDTTQPWRDKAENHIPPYVKVAVEFSSSKKNKILTKMINIPVGH